MQAMTLSLSRLASGGLITNYYCTSSCRHCLYRCGPRWKKDYISLETARETFMTITNLGCSSIHIGGGEPLLRPDKLYGVLASAQEAGMHIEYKETNSSWFRSRDTACEILENLQARGLSTLLVSISPFHNEYITFSKVKGVLLACRETGMHVFPWTADFIDEISSLDHTIPHSLGEYQEVFGPDYLARLPGRYWISQGGRSLETFKKYSIPRTVSELVAMNTKGCSELAEVNHFHIDLYGNYIPGLCAGLSIRKNDLGGMLDAKEYPLITSLYTTGVGGFCDYATRNFSFRAKSQNYGSKCELCFEIRKYLVLEKRINSKELQPIGHYENS